MNYIETHLVDHCNLKCKGCSHFSGLAKEYYKPIEEYKQDIKVLHNTIPKIDTIRLMGGEPLLHPDFLEFCIVTRQYYPQSKIVLVSNGILLGTLNDEQIDILNNNRITLCISDYKLNLNSNQLNKFKFKEFHNKQKMYNVSLDLDGKQNYIESFNNCDIIYYGCNYWKNNRIYHCSVIANIETFNNHFNKNIQYDIDDVSIDIPTHTEEEILNFLKTPMIACKYCDIKNRKKSLSDFSTSKGDIKEWII